MQEIDYKGNKIILNEIKSFPYKDVSIDFGETYKLNLDRRHISLGMIEDIQSGDLSKIEDALRCYKANIEFHINELNKIL